VRIGVSAWGATVDKAVEQVIEAEADGIHSVWFSSNAAGDPLVAMAFAARATERIELGTAVVQTFPCHPVLLANRVAAVVGAAGRGITLGVGPSHAPVVEGIYGLDNDHPGRHTEEYLTILEPLLAGRAVDFAGEDLAATTQPPTLAHPVSLLVSALAPRLLRVAGERSDGTVLWLANASAVAGHVVPRISAAAAAAGRPAPRVVAGLPVAVHDDVPEARSAAQRQFGFYDKLPNYRRIMDIGGVAGPADAAIVGDEATVRAQIEALFEAGATDVWAAPFAVGDDRDASRQRTRALLRELAAA
jgi:F420-dependent oxidoreductase-like protein